MYATLFQASTVVFRLLVLHLLEVIIQEIKQFQSFRNMELWNFPIFFKIFPTFLSFCHLKKMKENLFQVLIIAFKSSLTVVTLLHLLQVHMVVEHGILDFFNFFQFFSRFFRCFQDFSNFFKI